MASGARREARIVKTLYWSVEDNTPLLAQPAGERAYRYRFDTDFWLAGRYERGVFRRLIREYYGVDVGDRLLLFNRVSLGDYAAAVYGEGLRLGVLVHDGRVWRLRATGALASILEGLGARVYNLEPCGRRYKGKRVRLDAEEPEVLVAACSHVGPATRIAPGVYKVRDMAPRGFQLLPDTDVKHVVERNEAILKSLEAEAIGFVKRMHRGGRVYVSYSGGADSTAALIVTVEALGASRVTAVYADTGIEFPETLRYAERMASKLGVDLVVVEAGDAYWRELLRRGPPSRDRRWCTALLKIEPLRRFYSRIRPKLIIEGVRGLESTARLTLGAVSSSPVAPTARRAFPIYEWSRFEVQLYLAWKGIEPNPLYDEGLTRIGCIVCPAMHMYELYEVARRLHPARVEAILERIAALIGRSTALDGSWRFQNGGRGSVNAGG